MLTEVVDHTFSPYGEAEMICCSCSYVICRVKPPGEAEEAIIQIGGMKLYGGGAHHGSA